MACGSDPTPRAEADARPRFAAVYRAHFDYVWTQLRRLGVHDASLEDAAQEVFLVVARRLDDFDQRATVRTWLFAIARRIAFRFRRSAARTERRHRALALRQLPASPPDPDVEIQDHQAARLLAGFLDRLDDGKRAAFILGALEGLGRVEMGEALGINPNTAYARLRAAREQFDRTFTAPSARAALLAEAHRPAPASDDRKHGVWLLVAHRLDGAHPPILTSSSTVLTTLGLAALTLLVILLHLADPQPTIPAAATDASPKIPAPPLADSPPTLVAPPATQVAPRATATDSPPITSPPPIAASLPTLVSPPAAVADSSNPLTEIRPTASKASSSAPRRPRPRPHPIVAEHITPPTPPAATRAAVVPTHPATTAEHITPPTPPAATHAAVVPTPPATTAEHSAPPTPPATSAADVPNEPATIPGLGDDVALLGRARRTLLAGQPAAALALLDEHAARFPASTLREARAAMRVTALCRRGDGPRARVEAAAFLHTFPTSGLVDQVRATCPAAPLTTPRTSGD